MYIYKYNVLSDQMQTRAEFPSQESNRGGMIALIFGEHSHLKGMKFENIPETEF